MQAPLDNFNQDKNAAAQTLRERAIQDQCCGQSSVVERQIHSYPKKETTIFAVATTFQALSYLKLISKVNNLAKRLEKMNADKLHMKKRKVH